MSDFGHRLRQIRIEMKMSQEEFAKLLGTSKQVISRYENGQRSPKISVAADYAQKLGISLNVLNGIEDEHSMTIGEKIKLLREKHGMTQLELARAVGVSDKAVSTWENDINVPRMGVIQKIASYFNVSKAYLVEDDATESPALPPNLAPISKMPHHRVRMVGAVAAGVPILADEEYDVYVDAPEKADYALRIEGDSMEPTYLDGDVIYIREQPNVDDGRVAVVLVDDSATLKHVYHERDGLTLISDNHAYPPMRVSFADHDVIRILGVVVGYTRMYRRLS